MKCVISIYAPSATHGLSQFALAVCSEVAGQQFARFLATLTPWGKLFLVLSLAQVKEDTLDQFSYYIVTEGLTTLMVWDIHILYFLSG